MNLKTTFMQPVAERIRETCSFRKAYEVSAERETLTHRRWHTKAERVLRTLSSCRGSCHRSSDAWREKLGCAACWVEALQHQTRTRKSFACQGPL